MSFLNWPVERGAAADPRAEQRRKSIILNLLDQFGEAFPQITYELLWESATINAQALAWIGSVRSSLWRLNSPSENDPTRPSSHASP